MFSVLVLLGLCPRLGNAAEVVIRVSPADSATVLQEAIDTCRAEGGGTVIVEAGTHRLDRPLRFHDAADIALLGEGDARLELVPQLVMTAARPAPKGQRFIEVEQKIGLADPGPLEIQAPGRVDPTPGGGHPRQIPYFGAFGTQSDGKRLTLRDPLPYPVPAKTKIVAAYNAISVDGMCRNLTFAHLTIDGNRDRWPIKPLNHSRHCGVFAAGAYSYEHGPTSEPIRGLIIRDCTVREFHYRGLALYSAVDSLIADCRIEDTGGEGIDLDHFVDRCRVIGCRVSRAAVGVELNDASHCEVTGTVIVDCPTGIKLWRWYRLVGWNAANTFKENTIRRAAVDGISLGAGTKNTRVLANTVEHCATGIRLECENSIVKENVLRECGKDFVRVGQDNRVR